MGKPGRSSLKILIIQHNTFQSNDFILILVFLQNIGNSSSMKLRSVFLSIICFLVLSCLTNGQPVTMADAKKIAEKTLTSIGKGGFTGTIVGDSAINDNKHEAALYLFSESKGGFMIISADKRAYPLLCWSESATFSPDETKWPPAFKELIDSWKSQISYIREMNLKASPEISKAWTKLENGEDIGFYGTKDVSPLLATKWSQGCGYNAMCPVDAAGPCGRALTGCVATAMAQVIRYREHPVTGTGSKCYITGRYGELCTDFSSGTYDYAAMSNTSGNSAVAKLIYHCGVSVSMGYGPSTSSASSGSVATAMRTYFGYANGLIVSKNYYSEERWENILKGELENFRPVYYSGFGTVGHAFVLDGYKETNHFHVNWGWGGSYDGYFYLSNLNPAGMTFNNGQQAIVGMIPSPEFTGLDFSSAIDLGCKAPLQGDLSTGVNYVNYYKNLYPPALGKELLYKFTTLLNGRIRIKITNQSSSVYAFLLNYANKDSVLTYGTNGLIIDNTNPGTYYVVVESQDFSEPTFTIEAVCPTMEADLDINLASINPKYVQSLQTNVRLSSTIKNIGKTSASECLMEYYLSDDSKFDHGADKLLGNKTIPSLDPGNSTVINSILTMPDSLMPGYYYILFVADRLNIVPETDDDNTYPVYVTVPDSGRLDCSTSVALTGGTWHYGNTLTDGTNKLEKYSMGSEMTGPEVIHTFVSPNNGIVKISFVDKSPGVLYAMVFPICNENTGEQPMRVQDLTDTLATDDFYAIAGTQYNIVVDGSKGASGDYGLHVDLPGQCPSVKVDFWGKIDMCNGDSWPGFRTTIGHSNYQWFKDGASVRGANYYYYNPSSTGAYYVEITENGCTSVSEILTVRSDSRPDTAHIASLGATTFCQGSSVNLKHDNNVTYPVNWAIDDLLIAGATGSSYSAAVSGSYSLFTVNGACRVKSKNTIDINVLEPPVDLGDTLPFPSDRIRFYCPFNTGSYGSHEGGGVTEKSWMIGWDYEPIDDRFGNFWKARYLMGVDEFMYWSDYDTISDDYTLAFWFKTTTIKGGVIAGFFDSPWSKTKMESILYMSDNGKLHFWLSNGGTPKELSCTSSYNDGRWHYVMIQHDGAMTLEIDDGVERITSAGPYSKKKFSGYWTFGGVSLPTTVAEMPSSIYFMGAIDDILCLDEANQFATPYIIRQPKLKFSLAEALPVCVPASISLTMPFSQKGTEYKVWDRIRSLWAPVSAVGDGGAVQFGNAEVVMGNNEFQIVAKNLTTGCETVLDTVIVVNVWSVCTLLPGNKDETGLKVYPVPARDILYFESERLIKEIKIFDATGRIVHNSSPDRSTFGIDINNIPNGIYFYRLKTENDLIITGEVIVIQN